MSVLRVKFLISQSILRHLFILPYRVFLVGRNLMRVFNISLIWLAKRREFTNFTYELLPRNKEYLAWFVSNACDISTEEVFSYFLEIESNSVLQKELSASITSHKLGSDFANGLFWGRRIGWYAIVRATKPDLVVESGTDKGLGSVVLSEALLQNGSGRLITIDINSESGWLIRGRHSFNTERKIGSSLHVLQSIDQIDLFIHDSDHSQDYESREYETIKARLSSRGYVMSDNSHVTNSLSKWSLNNERNFMYFAEQPFNHWYPGAGIGISLPSNLGVINKI
jgi:hypothetical protein